MDGPKPMEIAWMVSSFFWCVSVIASETVCNRYKKLSEDIMEDLKLFAEMNRMSLDLMSELMKINESYRKELDLMMAEASGANESTNERANCDFEDGVKPESE
jgi:hypothetical protein